MKIFLILLFVGIAQAGEIEDARNCLTQSGMNSYQARKDRAMVLIMKDEINILRAWIMSYKAEVAAATSLGDLKTRVATLPDLSPRTSGQAKNAVMNKIAEEDAD